MKSSKATQAALCLVLALVAGCQLFSDAIKKFEDMTPKERSLWMMSVYNKEYAEYQAKALQPELLTEADKEIMRVEKEVMTRAWPLIKAYNAMVISGVWSEQTEKAALNVITELLGVGGGPDA